MAAAAEPGSNVVTIGADVEALAADHAEFHIRQRDAFDLVMEDGDEPQLALHFLTFARQLVERHAPNLDGADHWGKLVKVAMKLREGRFDLAGREFRHWLGFQHFAAAVLGAGGGSEAESPFIFLLFGHEEILHLGAPPDHENEQAGGHGIERAAVADFLRAETSARDGDDIVRRHVRLLVDEQHAVDFGVLLTGLRREGVLHQWHGKR